MLNYKSVKTITDFTATLILPIPKKLLTEENFAPLASIVKLPFQRLEKIFKGEKGEKVFLPQEKTDLLLLGIGDKKDFKAISRIFRTVSHKLSKKIGTDFGIYLNHLEEQEFFAKAIANGLLLGTYQIAKFKTEQPKPHPFVENEVEVLLYSDLSEPLIQENVAFGTKLAETQMEIMDLVNAPSNYKTPQHIAQWASASAKKYGYKATIWDKAQIEDAHLDALLAVNRGSECPPTFIILEHRPANAEHTVGLVGKGVTFDTGGLSIKPSRNMHYMKSDMGGAAAVLGILEMAAKLNLPINLVGIVPCTDNSVDALSIKPGDIINSYSGKTIEVIDTDAEGRLILSDGLAYMVKHFQPDVLINLATLTGSAVRTFGYNCGALFSTNPELANAIAKAGATTGERTWELPLWEEYFDDLKSDVADIKNLGALPMAGAIHAAKFLQFFTAKHPNWAHLDIAGVAFSEAEFSSSKSATAYGIHLLVEYLKASVAVQS